MTPWWHSPISKDTPREVSEAAIKTSVSDVPTDDMEKHGFIPTKVPTTSGELQRRNSWKE